jgi:hypothetical protein
MVKIAFKICLILQITFLSILRTLQQVSLCSAQFSQDYLEEISLYLEEIFKKNSST